MIGNQYLVEIPASLIAHPYFWKAVRLKAKCLDWVVYGKLAFIHTNPVYAGGVVDLQIVD